MVLEHTRLLTELKASWYVSFQVKSTSFFSRSWKGAIKEKREGMKVCDHAEKPLQFRGHLQGWHVVNGGDLGGVWVCTILVVDPDKKFD